MPTSVVLPANLNEWLDFERHLKDLASSNEDDYLELVKAYSKASLYFLLRWTLTPSSWVMPREAALYWDMPTRKLMAHPFVFDACNEIEEYGYNETLFLWARNHIKSTIRKGIQIQEIIKDREVCQLLFSVSKTLAKGHLSSIANEFKTNQLLKIAFGKRNEEECPEDYIFFEDPEKADCTFTVEQLEVNRRNIRQEKTISAYGLEKRLPVGHHVHRAFYDDVVAEETAESDTTRTNIKKKFRSSLNLRDLHFFKWGVWGTPYHFNDLYADLEREGTFKRISRRPGEDTRYPPPENFPTLIGKPVFLTPSQLVKKKSTKELGPQNYASQILLDPREGKKTLIHKSFLVRYILPPQKEAAKYNCYIWICLDPSSGKSDDPSAIGAYGLGWDNCWRFLDLELDKLDPRERAENTVSMAERWHKPGRYIVKGIIAESTGQASDAFWIKEVIKERGWTWPVRSVDSKQPKITSSKKRLPGRINSYVIDMMKDHLWKFPSRLMKRSCEWDGRKNVIDDYLYPVEMQGFGLTDKDHVLDSMAMPQLPYLSQGKSITPKHKSPHRMEIYNDRSRKNDGGTWMSL